MSAYVPNTMPYIPPAPPSFRTRVPIPESCVPRIAQPANHNLSTLAVSDPRRRRPSPDFLQRHPRPPLGYSHLAPPPHGPSALLPTPPASQSNSRSSSASPHGLTDHVLTVNAGTEVYAVPMSVLLSECGSLLSQLVRENITVDGQLLPDGNVLDLTHRNGESFQYILNYLKVGQRALLPADEDELSSLMDESAYFKVFGLVALVWCLLNRVRLEVYSVLNVDTRVLFNPSVIPMFWESVAVMSLCYYPRKQFFLVAGFYRSKHRLRPDSAWVQHEVFCPGCEKFDFAPYESDCIDLEKLEPTMRKKILKVSGRIVRIVAENHTCAEVIFDFEPPLKLHVPVKALLPADYESRYGAKPAR